MDPFEFFRRRDGVEREVVVLRVREVVINFHGYVIHISDVLDDVDFLTECLFREREES